MTRVWLAVTTKCWVESRGAIMLEWGQLIFLAYIFRWSAPKGVGQSVLSNSFASIRRIGLNHGALLSTRKTWWTQKMFTYLVGQIFLERQPVK